MIAADSLLMKGGEISAAGVGTGTGNSGNIMLEVGDLSMTRALVNLEFGPSFINSSISTSADVSDAGSIEITSEAKIKLRNHSDISASAGANGGNIHLTAPDLVYLSDSKITAIAAGTSGSGNGGNITIDPRFIILKNSLISANAAIGRGGNILLISERAWFELLDYSDWYSRRHDNKFSTDPPRS